MKRARADDQQRDEDRAKWRQVEVEAEAMNHQGNESTHNYYDNVCSQVNSSEDEMESQEEAWARGGEMD